MQITPISGYGHESATGQYEVKFRPGEPLAQADAVLGFKRLARELARRRRQPRPDAGAAAGYGANGHAAANGAQRRAQHKGCKFACDWFDCSPGHQN